MSEFKTEDKPGIDIRYWKERDQLVNCMTQLQGLCRQYQAGSLEDKLLEVYRHMQDMISENYGMGD